MRKLVLTTALVALAAPAFAADMPTKAPKQQNWLAYPYNGSGCYWGINTEASVAQANVSGNGGLFATSLVNGNLTAAGASVGGTVGCIKGNGTNWIAVQGTLDYQNITASSDVAGANANVASRWQATQMVKFGGFASILGALPNLGVDFPTLPPLPAIPNAISITGTAHPYVMAGVQEFGLTGNFGAVGGTSWAVAPTVGAGILNQVVDANGKLTGAVVDTYARVTFAGKGITLNNVFGSGAPVLGGAANMGTQYTAGIGIYY